MAKRKYDLVFSMGAACACTECLRFSGLQFSSFPFDWLFGSTLSRRTDILVDGCDKWLRPDLLELVKSTTIIRTAVYRNVETDITFNHDFPAGVPIAESIAGVREKYDRRFARLRALAARGGRALAVYITPFSREPPAPEEAVYCRRRLSERFPDTVFDILLLRHGENAEPQMFNPSEGVSVVTFDYRNRADTTGSNPVDRDRVMAFLKRQGYSARDYRTVAERRLWRQHDREKKYARFGATSVVDYSWKKMMYKLSAHRRKHSGVIKWGFFRH